MDFSKHIQKAEEALQRRNFDFAVQLYQQLLEIDPDQGEARAGLRRALRRRHETHKGGRLLAALRGATPLAVAKGLARAGRHDAAAKALESYLATSPMDAEANLLLGISLESAGHYASALAVYEFVAEIAPQSPEGLKRAGAMMRRKGDHVRALEYYERALAADPRDRDALKARKDLAAEAALSRQRSDEVGHSREQIRDKETARRLERSARRHFSDEDLKEELERMMERFADAPSDVELMLEMADVHERLKDFEAAEELVERALTYRPESFDLLARRGELRMKGLKRSIRRADREGDREAADRLERELFVFEVEDLRRRLELHPADAGVRLRLGKTLLRSGRFDEAAAELQKAVGDPRVKEEALFCLASCFQKKGFLDLARVEYQRALEGRPEVDERAREILYNLGAIAEAEGDPAQARSFYSRIYQVDIGFRDVAAKMEQLK